MRDANPTATYLKDYKPPEFFVETVDLCFTLGEEDTRVVSKLSLVKNLKTGNPESELVLAGEALQLDSVSIDQRQLSAEEFVVDSGTLRIPKPPKADRFVLELTTRTNPKANTALEGLYLSNNMFCTQCEAEGFRKITYFPDRPDIMAKFSTTIVADKSQYPVLLSNGNPVSKGEMESNRHWVKWEDPYKKPCYLFALIAGQLECLKSSYTTRSGRTVDLRIYVEKHDLDKCDHAMNSLKHAMRWDEEVYGREYDLDLFMIVAVSHFNMGAMENKGLNVFNSKYVLARPDTATDTDYEHIEGVIGHEYFHNWTGNRITCRDWFQLSLKEGLTVFRDQEFTADQRSRGVKRICDVNLLRTRQFAEDSGPMSHPVRPDAYIEINNFYTLTVYEKGAEIVRMIHTLLGAAGFRKGMDLYFQRHDGQAVTTDDFVKTMEDANAVDLKQFRRWYTQAGTPEISIRHEYDEPSGRLTLSLKQHCPPTPGQPEKYPLHIPVAIALLSSDGSELPLHLEGDRSVPSFARVLEITKSEQTFHFTTVTQEPIVSVLRGFSAPVKLKIDRSLEELAFLLSHDTDPFNRWEAGQQLASRIILDLVKQHPDGAENIRVDPLILEAFQNIVSQNWDDLSYLALLLTLPSESYLGAQMDIVDVEGIYRARKSVKSTITATLQNKLSELYHEYNAEEPGNLDNAAIGRRRIKNTCLDYLIELQDAAIYKLSTQQFRSATTMTDQIAALSTIVNSHHPDKAQCLKDFYEKWHREALVIDKWFSIQAMASLPDTFEKVQALRQHPAFDIRNPNRVRALISAFCQENRLHFHRSDGAGYEFLANHVIELNDINPQIASRLLEPLSHWQRFDNKRQALMKAQLQRIVSVENISKDVFEIASKSLVPQSPDRR